LKKFEGLSFASFLRRGLHQATGGLWVYHAPYYTGSRLGSSLGYFLQGFDKSNGVSLGGWIVMPFFTVMDLGGNGWASWIGYNGLCIP
jgi:hypothetical protein